MKAFLRLLALVLLLAPAAVHAADKVEIGMLDQVLGKPEAPVTIIEYASLTCPHCAHFALNEVPKVKAEWVDTGKAKLIYRDFPTSPVGLSVGASMVAHCSGKERYFGVMDLLFRNQAKWIKAQSPKDEIKRVVRMAGISSDDVDACLKRQDLSDAIQARAEEGGKIFNIEYTPSLVIDGTVHTGALEYKDLNVLLQAAYAKATKK